MEKEWSFRNFIGDREKNILTSTCLEELNDKKNYMNKILEVEAEKIIKPITTTDGAGVKLKRSCKQFKQRKT